MKTLSLGFSLLLAGLASAQIIVPSGAYPTIQSGIDGATNGQTVSLLPGSYKENIDLKGKDITLRSLNNALGTIIDGGGTGPTISILGGETRKCVIEGLTITGGLVTGSTSMPGGGIRISGSSPTIRRCIIRGNRTPHYGAGVGVSGSGTTRRAEPLIEDCLFLNNQAAGTGSASYASGGGLAFASANNTSSPDTPIVRNCHFEGNVANGRGGGVYSSYGFATVLDSCTFTRNSTSSGSGLNGGSAIFFGLNSPFLVRNCRVWGNDCPSPGSAVKYFNVQKALIINSTIAGNTGGGIAGYNNGGAFGSPTNCDVVNTILWNNGGTGEVTLAGTNPTIQITYSVVTGGYAGTGNLSTDPQLANAATGNHRLLSGSPCIDKGTNAPTQLPATDFEGDTRPQASGIDIGADERSPTAQLLYADAATFSAGTPKTVNFTFDCPGSTGALYLLLPGFSGTDPGLQLGSVHLPLNVDALTLNLLPNYPGLIGTLGTNGAAKIPVNFGPIATPFIGVDLSFAGLLIQNFAFTNATNSETLRIDT